MADASLVIRIVSDVRSGVEGMKKAKAEAGGLKGAMERAQPAAKAVGAGLVAAGVAAAKYASDLQQSTGAVDSVFKDHADSVKASAQKAATNVGLSTNAYQEMATVIGAQLKNMGTPMDEVASQTDQLVTLGADLAATFGGTTADAVSALSSLMRGETDPIEKYGVSIKQADIAAQKAKMGLSGLTGEADKQASAQAMMALLTAQTADAQGQFARESDSAAGSAQIAKAQVEDAAAALGEALLPAAAAAATALADFGQWAKDNVPLLQALAVVVGTVAAAIIAYNAVQKAIAIAQGIATAAQWAWNAALLANPITWIVLGIIALIAVIVLLVANWDTVKEVAAKVWDWITDRIADFVLWLRATAQQLLEFVVGIWNGWQAINDKVAQAIIDGITWMIDKAKEIIGRVVGFFTDTWNKVKAGATTAFQGVLDIIGGVRDKIDGIARLISGGLVDAWNKAKDTVTGWVDSAIGALQRIIDMARNVGREIRNALSNATGSIFGGGWSIFGSVHPVAAVSAATTVPTAARWSSNRPTPRLGIGAQTVINITVQGAVDPRSTARQIRDILNQDGRLRGATSLNGALIG